MPDGKMAPEYRGWLSKWTNYLKGYQKRWFVLSNGLLSYYRTQEEMAHTCRGTINLAGAMIDTVDSNNFIISNGGAQQFFLRAPSPVERQRWITALELAKSKAIKQLEQEHNVAGAAWSDPELDSVATLRSLTEKFEELTACSALVYRHGGELQREVSDIPAEQLSQVAPADTSSIVAQLKVAHEKATLVKVSTTALATACSEFMSAAQVHQQIVTEELNTERQKRQRLEETVEAIARQHNALECAVKKRTSRSGSSSLGIAGVVCGGGVLDTIDGEAGSSSEGSSMACQADETGLMDTPVKSVMSDYDDEVSGEDEDDQFFDAEDTFTRSPSSDPRSKSPFKRPVSALSTTTTSGQATQGAVTDEERCQAVQPVSWPTLAPMDPKRARQYRSVIPPKPSHRMSLWGIMKNCIGRDLSKIPMPVNFNEPLSFLQRLCEVELEYCDVLNRAARCDDLCEQLALVAAFTVSTYSSTAYRTGKPFNPMLGETYEFDRSADLGWRCLCEQVSHHPPASAMHAETRDWQYWQDYTMSSKFRGKYLQILPQGIAHLVFRNSGSHYTCSKVTTTIHNIIVGKLWVDQSGEAKIVNHTTGDVCHLKYYPYSYFSKDVTRKVTGVVYDANKVARYHLHGTWDNRMEYQKVLSTAAPGGPGVVGKTPNTQLGPVQVAWEKSSVDDGYDQRYGFCALACAMNDVSEEGMAPTDSRHRPDQRLMEEGNFEEANIVKVKLEDAQRARRRQREAQIAECESGGRSADAQQARYRPRWFESVDDPQSTRVMHKYRGGYWEAKAAGQWPGDLLDLWSTGARAE